jgi:hypothetical protein
MGKIIGNYLPMIRGSNWVGAERGKARKDNFQLFLIIFSIAHDFTSDKHL